MGDFWSMEIEIGYVVVGWADLTNITDVTAVDSDARVGEAAAQEPTSRADKRFTSKFIVSARGFADDCETRGGRFKYGKAIRYCLTHVFLCQ